MRFDLPGDSATNASSVRTSGKSIVGVFEEDIPRAWSRGRGNRKSAHTSENDRGGLILNPGDWRVLDETRRVLATPDGTDALSDVKLKHAALTRRFDDTPYNRALPSHHHRVAPLAQPVSYHCLPWILPSRRRIAAPRPRQARDRDRGSRKPRLFRTIRMYSFFLKHGKPRGTFHEISVEIRRRCRYIASMTFM